MYSLCVFLNVGVKYQAVDESTGDSICPVSRLINATSTTPNGRSRKRYVLEHLRHIDHFSAPG